MKLINDIDSYIKSASSRDEAMKLRDEVISAAEEICDEYLSEHCEYTGDSIHSCDCSSCKQNRKDAMSEMEYDSIRHG